MFRVKHGGVIMSIFNMIPDGNSKIVNEEHIQICWCKRHKGKLLYNTKTGKPKTIGGCYVKCIKALILALKYNIRFEINNREIEKKSIHF